MDTEESLPGSDKPVTLAGKAASEMAKAYFEEGGGLATVELEFDTDDPSRFAWSNTATTSADCSATSTRTKRTTTSSLWGRAGARTS